MNSDKTYSQIISERDELIKQSYAAGEPVKDIAQRHALSPNMIYSIGAPLRTERQRSLNRPVDALPSIVCPACSAESFNPNDIANRYCGRCRSFHDSPPAPRQPAPIPDPRPPLDPPPARPILSPKADNPQEPTPADSPARSMARRIVAQRVESSGVADAFERMTRDIRADVASELSAFFDQMKADALARLSSSFNSKDPQ